MPQLTAPTDTHECGSHAFWLTMTEAVCMVCNPAPPSDKHHAAILEIDEANRRTWRPITEAELEHERWRLRWRGWQIWDDGLRDGTAADGAGT